MLRNLNIRAFVVLLILSAVTSVNFTQCLIDIRNNFPNDSTVGGLDNDGNPVPAMNATALSYDVCMSHCGSDPAPFSWNTFSQQFSSWLLPWLALLSQLPYGANDGLSNLAAVVLTVGSPVLAAFSLFMTILNGRWIRREMADVEDDPYQRTKMAARVLNNLQQVPLVINCEVSSEPKKFKDSDSDVRFNDDPLSSLANDPQSQAWWSELHQKLEYPRTWSNIAISTMIWVFLAYLFTVIDSFTGDIFSSIEVNGQGIGTLWLWLLTIVLGWLKVSPRIPITTNEIYILVKDANEKLMRSESPISPRIFRRQPLDSPRSPSLRPPSLRHTSSRLPENNWAIRVMHKYPHADKKVYADEGCTSPLYNYARVFRWTGACQQVVAAFKGEETARIPLASSHVYERIFIAMTFSLLLQWGTAGSAIIVVWFTPTTGLGCRSLSYLVYASLSTFIWILMMISTCFSHLYRVRDKDNLLTKTYKRVAIFCRYLGNILAVPNALLILLSGLFQFGSVFDNCYCDSSVLGRGVKTYNVIVPTDVDGLRGRWGGGLALGIGSAMLYIFFAWLLLDKPLDEAHGMRVCDTCHGSGKNEMPV